VTGRVTVAYPMTILIIFERAGAIRPNIAIPAHRDTAIKYWNIFSLPMGRSCLFFLHFVSLLAISDGVEWLVDSNASYIEAMQNLSSGDIVTMGRGVYSGSLCCGQVIRVSNVLIRSQNMSDVTIDCVSQHRHFDIIAPNVSIEGIALINGFSRDSGGCVSGNTTGISLSMCRLENCSSLGNGGGMLLGLLAGATLQNVTIQRCSAVTGSAIFVSNNATLNVVQQLIIRLNSASTIGGGMYLSAYSTIRINATYTEFSNNTASSRGAALYAAALSTLVVLSGNVSFLRNAVTSSVSAAGGAMFVTQGSVVVNAGAAVLFQENTCGGDGGALALVSRSSWQAFGNVSFVGGSLHARTHAHTHNTHEATTGGSHTSARNRTRTHARNRPHAHAHVHRRPRRTACAAPLVCVREMKDVPQMCVREMRDV
jgi:predicted outer membrane repeat protein